MVCVGQNHLDAKAIEVAMRHSFDRATRANWGERGGLDTTVWRLEYTGTRGAISMGDLERATFRHCRILHSVGT